MLKLESSQGRISLEMAGSGHDLIAEMIGCIESFYIEAIGELMPKEEFLTTMFSALLATDVIRGLAKDNPGLPFDQLMEKAEIAMRSGTGNDYDA